MRRLWFALLVSMPAWAGKDPVVTVLVTDALGHPIQTAEVVIPVEGSRHRVNSVDGTWVATHLYPKDGTEVAFRKGDTITVVASAPRFILREVTQKVKGKTSVTVTLDSMVAPGLPCLELPISAPNGEHIFAWADEQLGLPGPRSVEDAWCLLGSRAIGASLAWLDALTTYTMSPTDDTKALEEGARKRARTTALDWLEWAAQNGADTSVAADLCRGADDAMAPCG